MRLWIPAIAGLLAGLLLQHVLEPRVEAQGSKLMYAVDSSSGAASVVRTDGSNAIKVILK